MYSHFSAKFSFDIEFQQVKKLCVSKYLMKFQYLERTLQKNEYPLHQVRKVLKEYEHKANVPKAFNDKDITTWAYILYCSSVSNNIWKDAGKAWSIFCTVFTTKEMFRILVEYFISHSNQSDTPEKPHKQGMKPAASFLHLLPSTNRYSETFWLWTLHLAIMANSHWKAQLPWSCLISF